MTSRTDARLPLRRSIAFLASEFVIIVLGVLTALAVDEWRSELERREVRDQLLSGLIADLQADQMDYQQFADVSKRRAAAARALLELEPENPAATLADGTNTVSALGRLGLTPNMETADVTFAEMTANGSGQAIEDTALRLRIARYYALARDRSDINTYNFERTTRYVDALEDLGMSPMHLESIDAGRVLANPRLRAMLHTLADVVEYAGEKGQEMLDENRRLLDGLRDFRAAGH